MNESEASNTQQSIYDWFEGPLGRTLQANEVDRLRPVLSNLYAVRAVQLGTIGTFDLLSSCDAPSCYIVDGSKTGDTRNVAAIPESLPFDHKSIDLALLPHTLDFSADPHQVLREVERVLVPEGHIVLLGFNPISFWGLRKLFTFRARKKTPWNANFIGLRRMKDWLKLMQFEITGGSMLYYRPPLKQASFLERLFVMDKLGDRWWPMMAGVYLLVAKKRVAGMTPIRRPQWRFQLVKNGLAQPSGYQGLGKISKTIRSSIKRVIHE